MELIALYDTAERIYTLLCRRYGFPDMKTLRDPERLKGFLKQNPAFDITFKATPSGLEPLSVDDHSRAVTFEWNWRGDLLSIKIIVGSLSDLADLTPSPARIAVLDIQEED